MKKITTVILIFLMSIMSYPINSLADEQENTTYFVRPVLTTNQTEGVTDYFDIRLGPDEKQTLQIEVHNKTEEEKTFVAVIENAITNDHGVIEYQHTTKEYDSTLKNKFTDIAKVSEAVEVAPGEQKKIDIPIQMPDKGFDGIILGGIRISEKGEEDNKKSTINNVFSYVVPVKIHQNDTPIANQLNFHGITIGQQTYENVIKANLQNPQPQILRELSIQAKIFKKNEKKVVYEETKKNMKLAPNSNFFYSISLGTNKFKAGKYKIELTAKAKDLDENWTEEFEITSKEAQEMNDNMVFKKKTNWGRYLLIGAVILLVIIIIYLLYRQRKIKQEAKKKMELKKMKKRKKLKKNAKKILILFLISSGLSATTVAYAETENNSDVSKATIKIKPRITADSSQEEAIKKPIGSIEKELPKTGENKAYTISYIGSILLLMCTAFILNLKIGRGRKGEN